MPAIVQNARKKYRYPYSTVCSLHRNIYGTEVGEAERDVLCARHQGKSAAKFQSGYGCNDFINRCVAKRQHARTGPGC